jgi:hypothetical protein
MLTGFGAGFIVVKKGVAIPVFKLTPFKITAPITLLDTIRANTQRCNSSQ